MTREAMIAAILEFTVGRIRKLTTIKKMTSEHVHGPDVPIYAMAQPGRPATFMVVEEGKDIIEVFDELMNQTEAVIKENIDKAPMDHIIRVYQETLTIPTKTEHPKLILD